MTDHRPSPVRLVRGSVLRSARDVEDIDSATETLLVEAVDDEGRVGLGEADTASDAALVLLQMADAHAWNAGIGGRVTGMDPFLAGAIHDRLVRATVFQGAGIARHVISAVDIALHDLAARQLNRPLFHLLGGARRDCVDPYATIYAGPVGQRTLDEMMDETCALLERAVSYGYRGVKMEVLFGDLASDRDLAACIRAGRDVVGDDVRLLIDFGYRWNDWRDAESLLRAVESCGIWLAEATLPHDDLDSHARLAARSSTRIGGAELASSREECRAWLDHAKVDVLQPDVTRAGGLTGLRRICDDADARGVLVVPHCWKTGIAAAATRHLQVATANVPLVEHLDPRLWNSPLRRDLVGPEPRLIDGRFALPEAPGLGVTLDRAIVATYLEERA